VRLAWFLFLLCGTLPFAAATSAQEIRAAPVEQAGPDRQPDQWKPGRRSTRTCFDAGRIAGAIVIDQKTLDLSVRAGRRWRLYFAEDCPHLGYYGGFYYRLPADRQLCARRDSVMGRSGSSCRIAAIAELKRVR
jgi:hypothetical protein